MVKKIAIISLSKGLLGEPAIKHEVTIGIDRLKSFGVEVVFTKNALKSSSFLFTHPKARADDLIDAFYDETIDMILCSIGGDDTYKILPYIFQDKNIKKLLTHKKIFLGFSDTTMNHLMLHKLGIKSFYGQSFLADICELGNGMLPYSQKYFIELITTGNIRKIVPSPIWYRGRTSFAPSQIGVKRKSEKNKGFELLQGSKVFYGKILGGCIETLYDIFDNTRYKDTVELCEKYDIFPSLQDWTGRILLLESSETISSPDLYRKMIYKLKETGIFDVINGIIVGKPFDEIYYEEYKKILIEEINNPNLSIVYNVNIGHSQPHCIIPFGVNATVDTDKQEIIFH